jgi:hypothetical protein
MQGPAAWSVFNQTEWATTLSGSGTVPGSGNRDDYRGRPHFVSDTSGEYIAISVRPVYTGNEKRQLQVLVERTSGSQGTTIAKLDGHRIVWFAGKRMHFLQSEGFTKRNWRHGSISMDRLVEVARASKQPFTSTAYQKQVTSEIEVSPDKLPMDLFSFGGGMADADPISISDVGLLLLTKTINGRIPALLTTDGELLTSSFALSHDWRQQQLLLIEKEPSGCVTLALLLFGRTIDFCVLRLLNGHLTAEVVPVELTEPMKNKDTRDVWSFGAISTSNGPMLIAHADTKVWGWKGEN